MITKEQLKQTVGNMWAAVGMVGGNSALMTLVLSPTRIFVRGSGGVCFKEVELSLDRAVQVSGEDFLKLLGAVPDGEFLLSLSETALTIRSGRFKASLPVMGSGEEEKLVGEGKEGAVEIDAETWAEWSQAALFACSPSITSMMELASIYQNEEGIWACNRVSALCLDKKVNKDFSLTIPKTAILAIQKIAETPQTVEWTEDTLLFSFPRGQMLISWLSSEFPISRIQEVLKDRTWGAVWTCERSDMENALKSVGALGDELFLSFHSKRLIIKTKRILSQYQVGGTMSGESSPDVYMILAEEMKRLVALSEDKTLKMKFDWNKGHLFFSEKGVRVCCVLSQVEKDGKE